MFGLFCISPARYLLLATGRALTVDIEKCIPHIPHAIVTRLSEVDHFWTQLNNKKTIPPATKFEAFARWCKIAISSARFCSWVDCWMSSWFNLKWKYKPGNIRALMNSCANLSCIGFLAISTNHLKSAWGTFLQSFNQPRWSSLDDVEVDWLFGKESRFG